MKTSDIVKGAIVVAAVAGFFYFINQPTDEEVSEPEFQFEDSLDETERQIEERFNTQVPEGAERAQLRNDEIDGRALATREVTEEGTTVSILADIPDPEEGSFYQAWVVKGEEGEEDFERISLGRLRVAKGGFVTELISERDLSEFDNLLITQETALDSTAEKVVLEGSF